MFVRLLLCLILCTAGGTWAQTSGAAANIDTDAIAANPDGDWLSYGKSYREQRYSPLKAINRDTVDELGLAWSFDTDFNRGLEGTPLVVDGVMYVTGNWSVVYALDARSGEMLWKYDPEVPREWAKMACCDVVNRGVALYEGKIFVGTLDARLIALDADTGDKLWSTQTADIDKYPYTITGAPRAAKGLVFIGNGGAEYGVRGFVAAYDVDTGEQVWKFYTVPGNPADGFENDAMRRAAETWTGEWWKFGGGGTVWDSIVYDPELDQLYIGVGNGSPWNHRVRSPEGGDNLYLSSIVALNPDTGEYLWHYQETPAETWDYTATQPIMLADMEVDGESRKVIWHAPKNGFFFVIDRESGELISADPFARINWATHYDMETGRPVETEIARYADKAELVRPSSIGAHNWHPMAFSPDTGYVYIPTMESLYQYVDDENFEFQWGHWNFGVDPEQPGVPDPVLSQFLIRKMTEGHLLAWDPVARAPAWKVQHPLTWNGGVLATAGRLVFQGTSDERLLAVADDSGDIVWSYPTRAGIMAPPVSYEVDGAQYLTVLVGWGGGFGLMGGMSRDHAPPPSRVLTFKLGGEASLPENSPLQIHEPPPRLTEDEEVLGRGRNLFHRYCSACHGQDAVSGGGVPDLRHLPRVFHDNFNAIVLDGIMKKAGMVGFGDVLSEEDAYAIHAYILDRANLDKEWREQPAWWQSVKTWFYDLVSSLIAWIS